MTSNMNQTLSAFKKTMLTVLIAGFLITPSMAQTKSTTEKNTAPNPGAPAKPVKKGYAPVNGLQLYYEIYGKGEPMILLHGGLGAIEMFTTSIPELSKNRQVIAVDLQGHGRTADIDRPLSVITMADDIAALMKHLNIKQADIVGYSFGGGVALQTAILHPEVVRKLVVMSTPIRRNAFHPEILQQQAMVNSGMVDMMKQTPMYQLYASIAPKPEDFGKLLDKIGAAMKEDFDFSAAVKTIKAPTLIIAGDADIFRPSHAVEIFELLGGGLKDGGWDGSGQVASQLAILPGVTHYNAFMSPAWPPIALAFLDGANKGK